MTPLKQKEADEQRANAAARSKAFLNMKNPSKSSILTDFWSEWRDSNARLPHPKCGALPTGLHPDSLFSFFAVMVRIVVKHGSSRFPRRRGKRFFPTAARLCAFQSCAGRGVGYMLPNQARYQLRYTRIVCSVFSPLWSGLWSNADFCGFRRGGASGFLLQPQGFAPFGDVSSGALGTCSQITHATNCATPGCILFLWFSAVPCASKTHGAAIIPHILLPRKRFLH